MFKRLTQTASHNCFQTCAAILLNVDPIQLPEQLPTNTHDEYVHRLRCYLNKQYCLTYIEIPSSQTPPTQLHIMIGETVRTKPENKNAWHAVIGQGGALLWDVSESRDGLTKVHAWGWLMPTPMEWREKLR